MITINNESKSFKEFLHRADIAGNYISSITDDRDVVLISDRTSWNQIEAYVGSILYGRIPVIVSYPSSKVYFSSFLQKIEKIYETTNASLCVSSEFGHVFNEIMRCVEIDEDIKYNKDIERTINIDQDSTAFIQLSSGTTGLPKVFEISHKSLIENCDEYYNMLGLTANDSIVSWLPLYHDMGLIACFWLPLLNHIPICLIDPFDWMNNPYSFFDAISEHKGTHVWMPNFAFSFLADKIKTDTDLSSVKRWTSCSEVCSESDCLKFQKAFSANGVKPENLSICYAMAENIFAVSHRDGLKSVEHCGRSVLSCGDIVPGTSVIIVKDGEDVTENDVGEVYIKSSYMPSNIDLSFNGYYNTGDVGFMQDCELFVLGRSDDLIISYGRNIYPYDIESSVSSIDDIMPGRVACFGVYNKTNGTQDIYICAESDSKSQELKLSIMSSVMKSFDLSVTCCLVDPGWLIKTSSGKLDRKSIRTKLMSEK